VKSYGQPLFGGDQGDGNSSNNLRQLDTTKKHQWAVELALKSDASKIFLDLDNQQHRQLLH